LLWPQLWLELLSRVNETLLRNAEGSNEKVRVFVAASVVVCDRHKDLTRLAVRWRWTLRNGKQSRGPRRVHDSTLRGSFVREASSLLTIRSKESRRLEGIVGRQWSGGLWQSPRSRDLAELATAQI